MKRWLPMFVLCVCASVLNAEVKLSRIFADNMILQRDVGATVYGTAEDGATVAAEIDGQSVSATAKDGRFLIKLPAHAAGGPYTLKVTSGSQEITLSNVLYGDIWYAGGQSNMAAPIMGSFRQEKYGPRLRELTKEAYVRCLKIPIVENPELQEDLPETTLWVGAETGQGVGRISAVGYSFGLELAAASGVPIGIIHASRSGGMIEGWVDNDFLKEHKLPPTVPRWFNAMTGPMQQFPIKGVVWYQGEANAKTVARAKQYATLFPAMIQSWRKGWNNPDMPFLFVQLAGWGNANGNAVWPTQRESQAQALKLPNTAMATAIDLGHISNIHPHQKPPIGRRLANAALATVYGKKDLVYYGPMYKSMKVKDGKIVVTFDHTGSGMMIRDGQADTEVILGDTLKGFVICGEDKKFVPAQAKIEGNTVVVWSDEVAAPIAVRYAWDGFPTANLYNKEDLPTFPFRSDTFEIPEYVPQPRKSN